jgi:hypothetical protein
VPHLNSHDGWHSRLPWISLTTWPLQSTLRALLCNGGIRHVHAIGPVSLRNETRYQIYSLSQYSYYKHSLHSTFFVHVVPDVISLQLCTPKVVGVWFNSYSLYIKTPWPESASALYRPSDRRSSAKLVPTFCGYRVTRGQRDGSLRPHSRLSRPEPLPFLSSSSLVVLTRLSGPRSRPTTSQKIW